MTKEHLESLTNKNYYDGFFVGNYKRRFEQIVTDLLAITDAEGNPPSLEIRKAIIEALSEAYITQVGDQPDGVQVQRLANWLLYEDLTDGRPDKVSLTEYPFMTKRQLRTRYAREMADENIPKTLTEQKYLGGKKQRHYVNSNK